MKIDASRGWNDYFRGSTFETYSHKRTRLSASATSYYVFYSKFILLKNRSIEFLSTAPDTCLLLEDDAFSQCSNDNIAGVILFESKGQCVQNRICSYQSKTNTDIEKKGGIYCFICVSSSENCQNKIIDSSIVETGDNTNIGHANIYLYNGETSLYSINESHASTNAYSFHRIENISTESDIKFSTFANNNHVNSQCSNTHYTAANYKIVFNIKNCNFKNNSGHLRILNCHGMTTFITSCLFIGNKGNNFTLGHVWGGSITVDKCYFDEYKVSEGPITINSTLENPFDQVLFHLSTFICNAEVPFKNINPCHPVYISRIEYQCFERADEYAIILLLT